MSDTPKAGRELDAAINRVVFGEDVVQSPRSGIWGYRWTDDPLSDTIDTRSIPYYSSDIGAAWKVVECMRERGWSFALWVTCPVSSVLPMPMAAFRRSVYPPTLHEVWDGNTWAGSGETPALAICRAALAALAGEEQGS